MNLFEAQSKEFQQRHIGPDENQTAEMLKTIGVDSLEELVDRTVPAGIRMKEELNLPPAMNEAEYLQHIKEISLKNKLFKNYIGQGYYDTITPSVILRNVFENPGWYTQYTPYQAEISQGRLESLLNFQTMVSDLTGLPLANASLLDEATAAAEAMTMFFNLLNKDQHHISRPKFFVDNDVFPQTKDVVVTRAVPVGIEVVYGDYQSVQIDETYFGALVQYPNDKGSVEDYR
ncbi:MAG TPA: glycine dehydrogenase (aminomethyl-transferring), partial [Flavisolibacter sp.]|nr:glycine dehydrogenase (aminomethyl-transferring) [Flavisolibacter sp.]